MDLKKITAFVMLFLMVIPSFGVRADDTPEEETAVGLRCAIERADIFIGKIEATVERLKEKGYIVQDIDANLTDAKFQLGEAEKLLDLLDFDAAEQEFSKAREILGSIMGWVHSTAKKVKITKTVKFMEKFQSQIQGVNGTLLRLQDRRDAGITASARGVLTSTMKRLQQLRRRMDANMINGNLEDTLDELEDMVEDMSEVDDMIRGNKKGHQGKGKN